MIYSHLALSQHEWKFLEACLQPKLLKKGQLLLSRGQTADWAVFVGKGIIRNFLIHDKKELTLFFAFENELAAPYEFYQQLPMRSALQALTQTSVLLIHYQDLQDFYALSANTQKLGRLLMEHLYLKELERSKIKLALRPQDHYAYIEKQYPQLIHKVQSQHLASYMGITRESLSRIKRRRSRAI